jgi:hypothetical protein
MSKIFRIENTRKDLNYKCGGCNYEAEYVYIVAKTLKEAKKMYKNQEAGMCPYCLVDWMCEEKMEVT